MTAEAVLGLLQNGALLLGLGAIYAVWPLERRGGWLGDAALGLAAGLVGVVVMTAPWSLAPGLFFDTRSILLVVVGLYLGWIPTVVAVLVTALARVLLEGQGMLMGLGVIVSSAGLGLWWRWALPERRGSLDLLVLGLLVHVTMLAWTLTLPHETTVLTLRLVTFPVLVGYPLGTVLLGRLFELERQRRESAAGLQRSERRFRAVVQAAPDAVVVLDPEGRVASWNPSAERILGVEGEELSGWPMGWAVRRDTLDELRDRCRRRSREGRPGFGPPVTTEVTRPDGSRLPVEVTASEWDDGSRAFLALFLRDISDRLDQERSHALLAEAVEQSSNLVVITDTEGTIQYVNGAFETITGYPAEEAVGQNPRILKSGKQDEAFYRTMWRELTQGRPWTTEFTNRRRDGTEYIQRSTIFPIHDRDRAIHSYVGIAQDVTSERALEEQLRQAQKMETVGQLTGGIAHDFNNALTAILGMAQLLHLHLPEEEEDGDSPQAMVREIEQVARRSASLVRKLMTFSRDQPLEQEELAASAILAEARKLLVHTLPESIELRVEDRSRGTTAWLDPGAVQQVLLNLANNARDAMPRGGVLELGARIAPTGSRLLFTVADTGCGIPREDLERVFEPFFTRKAPGHGTGLGLAMVQALVQRQGGTIELESREGQGTTFTLAFPVGTPREARAPRAREPEASAPVQGRGERILVVEDDPAIRAVAVRILERRGFRATAAEDGRKGLAVLEAADPPVDLVLSDMVMPGLGGVELFRASRALCRPPLFVLSSGHAQEALAEAQEELVGLPFLPKPWNGAELLDTVGRTLAEARPRSL